MKHEDLFDRVMQRKKAEIEELLSKHQPVASINEKSDASTRKTVNRNYSGTVGESEKVDIVFESENRNDNNRATTALVVTPSNTTVLLPVAKFFANKNNPTEKGGEKRGSPEQILSSDEHEFSSDESLLEDRDNMGLISSLISDLRNKMTLQQEGS